MKDPIDMVRFVADLARRPRGRAAVVLADDYLQESAWSRRLAEQTKSDYVDLLEEFKAHQDLSGRLGAFTVAELFRFLGQRKNAPVLIVNNLEFLFATWASAPNALDEFATQLEMWRSSPALLFVIRQVPALANRKFIRHEGTTFVVDQRDTLQL